MKLAKACAALMVSLSVTLSSFVAVPTAYAADDETSSTYNDTTFFDTCKDVVDIIFKPFNVFEIYNAYMDLESPDVTGTTATTPSTTAATLPLTTTTPKKTDRVTAPPVTAPPAVTTFTSAVTSVQTTSAPTFTTKLTSGSTDKVTAPPVTAPPVTDTEITTEPTVTTAPSYILDEPIRGVDVSQWQGNIDFQALKDSGDAEFVIIKAGWGSNYNNYVDPYFHQNIKMAQEAGLGVGVYWYSYAHTPEQARIEAELCYNTIKDYSFDYPVYFDFEEWSVIINQTTAQHSAIVESFCSTMESKGYYTGIYSSGSYLKWNIYRSTVEKYDIWVAEYNSSVQIYDGDYGMWQYSGSGWANGFYGQVDLDLCYKDYPALIGVNPSYGHLPVYTTTLVPKDAVRGFMAEDSVTTAVDWAEFDKDTYEYAMLVVDESSDLDVFTKNLDGAHEAGIDCGVVYIAEDKALDGVSENVVKLREILAERQLEYPVYYWFSKSDFDSYTTDPAQLSANADAFCSYFEEIRYYSGIAAYDNALKNSIDNSLYSRFDLWLFNEKDTKYEFRGKYNTVSVWDEEIGGFAHYSKTDFPSIMKKVGLNGF